MCPSAKDLSGQRFSRLVALEPTDERRGGCVVWRCKCDCGKTHPVASNDLIAGKVKSCGCLVRDLARELGRQHAKTPGGAARNSALTNYKNGAKGRRLSWELTDEQVTALFGQNCYYCGAPPSNTRSIHGCIGDFTYNGIDRIDNSQGYTKENCVTCCWYCNQAKSNMSLEEFKAWVTRVYKHTIEGGDKE